MSPPGVRRCRHGSPLFHHGGGVHHPLELVPCCHLSVVHLPSTGVEPAGEPDAFDYYMLHVQWQHIAKLRTRRLEWDYARTSKDTTFWGLNPCYRYVELGTNYPPHWRAPVEANVDLPMMRASWASRQKMDSLYGRGFPEAKFVDNKPFWEGRLPWPRGGTNPKHQREKEVQRRREEEAACSSPVSSSSCTSKQATQAERLRLILGTVRPPLVCGGVALSAALTYKDTYVKEEEKAPECWSFARVMIESRWSGQSIVD